MTALMVSMSKAFYDQPRPRPYSPQRMSPRASSQRSTRRARIPAQDGRASIIWLVLVTKPKQNLTFQSNRGSSLFAGPPWLERLPLAFRALQLAQNSPGLAVAHLGPIG